MTKSAQVVLEQALRLDSKGRAELAAELLASLDGPADVNEAWEQEIRHRIAAVDAGEVDLEPWDSVRRRIEKGVFGR